MSRSRHVKKRIGALLLGCCFASAPLPAQDGELTAPEILKRARLSQGGQNRQLSGRLRNEGRVVPFRLWLDGGTIRYEFYNPREQVILRLGETGSRLEEVTAQGGRDKVTEAEGAKPVRDTGITLEDLSLRFLYWPRARLEGEQTILTRKTWKLHLEPGSPGESQYGAVLVWVEKESNALLRVECFDKRNALTKRFEVKSVQKSDDGWILKQMRIEDVNPATQKIASRTYLEIDAPKE